MPKWRKKCQSWTQSLQLAKTVTSLVVGRCAVERSCAVLESVLSWAQRRERGRRAQHTTIIRNHYNTIRKLSASWMDIVHAYAPLYSSWRQRGAVLHLSSGVCTAAVGCVGACEKCILRRTTYVGVCTTVRMHSSCICTSFLNSPD